MKLVAGNLSHLVTVLLLHPLISPSHTGLEMPPAVSQALGLRNEKGERKLMYTELLPCVRHFLSIISFTSHDNCMSRYSFNLHFTDEETSSDSWTH